VNASPTPLPSLVEEQLSAPAVQGRLIGVLTSATTAQRRDAAVLKQLVEHSFGPPALVGVWTDPGPDTYGARLDEGNECLTVSIVGSAAPKVFAAAGNDCRGG
jgi:hypothetical protein